MGAVVKPFERLFSGPKAPEPDPSIAKSQKRQEEILDRQEKRAEQEKISENKKIQRRSKRRRTGGLRMLLSSSRANPIEGISDELKNTLGG